jgi:hypothetical protein
LSFPPFGIEMIGYLAGGLVLTTFCMRTMLPLRLTAIASNLAFIAYGAAAGLMPILVLHGVLLPLNLLRLVQLRRLVRQARAVTGGALSMDWLIPHLKTLSVPAGAVLFNRGDPADRLYVVAQGAVLIDGVGVTLRDGALFGEMAMFADTGRRSQTARCVEDCKLLWVDRDDLALLCNHHPALAFHLIRLITNRLLANEARLQAQLEAAGRRETG